MSVQVPVQPASSSVGNIAAQDVWTGQSAALAAQTIFTVGSSDANFRLDYSVHLAASGVAPVTPVLTFTDPFGNVQSINLIDTNSAFGQANAVMAGGSIAFRAKSGTNIQISSSIGSGSAPTYNLYASLIQN